MPIHITKFLNKSPDQRLSYIPQAYLQNFKPIKSQISCFFIQGLVQQSVFLPFYFLQNSCTILRFLADLTNDVREIFILDFEWILAPQLSQLVKSLLKLGIVLVLKSRELVNLIIESLDTKIKVRQLVILDLILLVQYLLYRQRELLQKMFLSRRHVSFL